MGASGLGTLLVKEGLLSEQDRQTISKTCGQNSWAFAKCVLAMGMLDEDELAAFFADHTKYSVAPRDFIESIDKGILQLIDARMAARLEMLPLRTSQHSLEVAVVDPLDKGTIRQLEFFTGFQAEPVIAPLSQIYEGLKMILEEFVPHSTDMKDFLENHAASAWQRQRIAENIAQGSPQQESSEDHESLDGDGLNDDLGKADFSSTVEEGDIEELDDEFGDVSFGDDTSGDLELTDSLANDAFDDGVSTFDTDDAKEAEDDLGSFDDDSIDMFGEEQSADSFNDASFDDPMPEDASEEQSADSFSDAGFDDPLPEDDSEEKTSDSFNDEEGEDLFNGMSEPMEAPENGDLSEFEEDDQGSNIDDLEMEDTAPIQESDMDLSEQGEAMSMGLSKELASLEDDEDDPFEGMIDEGEDRAAASDSENDITKDLFEEPTQQDKEPTPLELEDSLDQEMGDHDGNSAEMEDDSFAIDQELLSEPALRQEEDDEVTPEKDLDDTPKINPLSLIDDNEPSVDDLSHDTVSNPLEIEDIDIDQDHALPEEPGIEFTDQDEEDKSRDEPILKTQLSKLEEDEARDESSVSDPAKEDENGPGGADGPPCEEPAETLPTAMNLKKEASNDSWINRASAAKINSGLIKLSLSPSSEKAFQIASEHLRTSFSTAGLFARTPGDPLSLVWHQGNVQYNAADFETFILSLPEYPAEQWQSFSCAEQTFAFLDQAQCVRVGSGELGVLFCAKSDEAMSEQVMTSVLELLKALSRKL